MNPEGFINTRNRTVSNDLILMYRSLHFWNVILIVVFGSEVSIGIPFLEIFL